MGLSTWHRCAATALLVVSVIYTLGAADAAARVLPVKDGKKAAFLIQFDDAHASQIPVVIPALRERKLVGTFYIFNRQEQLLDRKDAWMQAAKEGIVTFGNHTFTHKYTNNSFPDVDICERELTQCNDLIREFTPDLPWPRLIAYARPGGRKPADPGIGEAGMQPVLEKLYLFPRPNFWGAAIHVKTLADMKRVVDQAVANGGMGHLDFHGVGKPSAIDVAKDDFIAFVDYVAANRESLWVTDCASWHAYETERKDAVVAVLRSTAQEIAVSLTSGAEKTFYREPLTIECPVPAAWTRCQATQDGKAFTVEAGAGTARFSAVPNAGEIVLRPAGPS
jgi:peptidoglycan/xylan/chitin deacetylase (PgdA/CDA1 family)